MRQGPSRKPQNRGGRSAPKPRGGLFSRALLKNYSPDARSFALSLIQIQDNLPIFFNYKALSSSQMILSEAAY
jgi:hypothetical protein